MIRHYMASIIKTSLNGARKNVRNYACSVYYILSLFLNLLHDTNASDSVLEPSIQSDNFSLDFPIKIL
jgi:hypothetical protein